MQVTDFAAAFTFRAMDIYGSVERKFSAQFAYFSKSLVLIESTDDSRYYLFADMSGVQFTFQNPVLTSWRQLAIDPFSFEIPVYALTRQEFEDGEDPSSGLVIKFELSSQGNSVIYEIGAFQDKLGKLEIGQDELLNPGDTSAEDKEGKLSQPETYFVGARGMLPGSVRVSPLTSAPTVLDWLRHTFPEYESAIVRTVFADVKVIDDAKKGVMPNVQLVGDVFAFWETRSVHLGEPVDVLTVASDQAKLLAPDCPVYYETASIPQSEIENAQNSIAVGSGKVSLSDIKVVAKSQLAAHYRPANGRIQSGSPFFSLYISRPLLSDTFDYRIGKNLGAMLGVHYADRAGPFKWYMSGAWIVEGVSGSAGIDMTSAAVSVRFEGRTKFDALAYVDIGCFSYKLGDMDAFHENFDFTLGAKVYLSPDGKLVFVGSLGNLSLSGWQCFIDTFIDRYISSWHGMVAEIVAKYIVGILIRDFVEGEISKAMGTLSLDIFDFRRLPVVGGYLETLAATRPEQISGQTLAYGDMGLEISVGTNNW